MILDRLAEIVVVLAFLIMLFVVPGWASGLIPGRSSDAPLPRDTDDAAAPADTHHALEAGHGDHPADTHR